MDPRQRGTASLRVDGRRRATAAGSQAAVAIRLAWRDGGRASAAAVSVSVLGRGPRPRAAPMHSGRDLAYTAAVLLPAAVASPSMPPAALLDSTAYASASADRTQPH